MPDKKNSNQTNVTAKFKVGDRVTIVATPHPEAGKVGTVTSVAINDGGVVYSVQTSGSPFNVGEASLT